MTWLLLTAGAGAQSPTPSAPDDPIPTPIISAPSPSPVTLTDLAATLDSARARLKEAEATAELPTPSETLTQGLHALSLDVNRSLPATRILMAQNPSPVQLRELESEWKIKAAPLVAWKKELTDRAAQLDAASLDLSDLDKAWQNSARKELPAELQAEVGRLHDRMDRTLERVRLDRNKLLLALDRINFVEGEVATVQAAIDAARQQQVRQLLDQDAPALWYVDFASLESLAVQARLNEVLRQELSSLGSYAKVHAQLLLIHLMGFGVIYLMLKRAGDWVRPRVEGDPGLQRTVQVFGSPFSTGLVLAYVISPWLYPKPPVLLTNLMGLAVIIPAGLVLTRILDRYWHPTLVLYVSMFVVDQVRELFSSLPILSRLILLGELTVVVLFLLFRTMVTPKVDDPELGRTHRVRALTLVLVAVAWLASVLGLSNLAILLGQGTLWSAYLAIFLIALVRVLDAMLAVALRTPPLSMLPSVQAFRPLYRERLYRLLGNLARLFWLWETLGFLGLRDPLAKGLTAVLTASLSVGGFNLSLGTLVTLGLALYIPYHLSRLFRFHLEQDVYPRLGLTVGHAYTFSQLVHYVVLTLGVLIGLSIVGLDMTKLTIVAGALSVGIGFGLQNIVNNFVSGLILLFERPVQVGDQIEVGGLGGTLQRIGIRASVLRTADGSEVIVPNGELISQKVTNWTLSDRNRLLRVDVGVAYGTKIPEATAIILEIAAAHHDLVPSPEPEVLLLALADSSLNLQLRAWTERPQRWQSICSELLEKIYDRLGAAGIEIPFPQRTVHLVQEERPVSP